MYKGSCDKQTEQHETCDLFNPSIRFYLRVIYLLGNIFKIRD